MNRCPQDIRGLAIFSDSYVLWPLKEDEKSLPTCLINDPDGHNQEYFNKQWLISTPGMLEFEA